MIEVFCTNVKSSVEVAMVRDKLQHYFPQCKISVDLHDWDKVLRVEGADLVPAAIQTMVMNLGFECLPLS